MPLSSFFISPFGDVNLEQAYQNQLLKKHGDLLIYFLLLITISSISFSINHLPQPDGGMILSTITAILSVILIAILTIKNNEDKKDSSNGNTIKIKYYTNVAKRSYTISLIISFWLTFVVILLMITGEHYVIIITITLYISFYMLFPFELSSTIIIGVILSFLEIILYILWEYFDKTRLDKVFFNIMWKRIIENNEPKNGNVYEIQETSIVTEIDKDRIMASIIAHIWCNFIGIYLYIIRSRLTRATFLNARGALRGTICVESQNTRIDKLLSRPLPPHVMRNVKKSIKEGIVPQIHVETFNDAVIIYGKIHNLENILSQISVQDGGRLLNELEKRIDMIVEKNNCIRIVSDCIIICSGIPSIHTPNNCSSIFTKSPPRLGLQAAMELALMIKSFVDVTQADISFQIGISQGIVNGGIMGLDKWHYDIIGQAVDRAKELCNLAIPGNVFIDKNIGDKLCKEFSMELINDEKEYRIKIDEVFNKMIEKQDYHPSVVFPSQKRLSMTTVSQSINRLLETVNSVLIVDNIHKRSTKIINNRGGKRQLINGEIREKSLLEQDERNEYYKNYKSQNYNIMNSFTLRFRDHYFEKYYHKLIDRWLIPALITSMVFIIISTFYQQLIVSKFTTILVFSIFGLGILAIMFAFLFLDYFQFMCQFITQTCIGHSTVITTLLFSIMSCTMYSFYSCDDSIKCSNPNLNTTNLVMWMIIVPLYVKLSNIASLITFILSIIIYTGYVFEKQAEVFVTASTTAGWRVDFDLLITLLTLSFILYIRIRRNEKLQRCDHLSAMRIVEEKKIYENYEKVIENIMYQFLPKHIANSYDIKSEPYCHLFHAAGIAYLQIMPGYNEKDKWNNQEDFKYLNEIIINIDQMLSNFNGLVKVRNSNDIYIVAAGVLPESSHLVQEAPSTIGDLLSSLTDFAIQVRGYVKQFGIWVKIGIDCGPAISYALGDDKPTFNITGKTYINAMNLSLHSHNFDGLMVSEEIYLALRPRQYKFADEHVAEVKVRSFIKTLQNEEEIYYSIPPESSKKNEYVKNIEYTIKGYVFESDLKAKIDNDMFIEELDPQENSKPQNKTIFKDANAILKDHCINPIEFLSSMNTSYSSDVYSIDIDIESDSDIEWCSPQYTTTYPEIIDKTIDGEKIIETTSLIEGPSSPPLPAPSDEKLLRKGSTVSDNQQRLNSFNKRYMSNRALVYSDFSESEALLSNYSPRIGSNKRVSLTRNGPKIPHWLTSSKNSINTSEMSINQKNSRSHSKMGSLSALDRLNATALKVDRMLKELACVDDFEMGSCKFDDPEYSKFPLHYASSIGGGSNKSSLHRFGRGVSSTCHTDYDNMDSEANSDQEVDCQVYSKLEELKKALKGTNIDQSRYSNSSTKPGNRRNKKSRKSLFDSFKKRKYTIPDTGDEADGEESNCSSLAASQFFDNIRWKSVHSIGYENEYEFTDDNNMNISFGFIDDDIESQHDDDNNENENQKNNGKNINAKEEMAKLARDIQQNFGDYKLASFEKLN
ncbi:Adenylyl cyclase V [Strongyloides ratti]|uniref:adenylate cyclase n=1 Tax=Strongyloides ratti TaxID=34506 RepID=A0A090MY94_STRRB|nr:Adenylyl cyclase V [Strongyloides ratti]CEF66789.1 Adenylyl cyclase V [Strongyloides ratti]